MWMKSTTRTTFLQCCHVHLALMSPRSSMRECNEYTGKDVGVDQANLSQKDYMISLLKKAGG